MDGFGLVAAGATGTKRWAHAHHRHHHHVHGLSVVGMCVSRACVVSIDEKEEPQATRP